MDRLRRIRFFESFIDAAPMSLHSRFDIEPQNVLDLLWAAR